MGQRSAVQLKITARKIITLDAQAYWQILCQLQFNCL